MTFIFENSTRNTYILLIELKSTNVEHAVAQLLSVRQYQEYQSIVEYFAKICKTIEKFFIITDH